MSHSIRFIEVFQKTTFRRGQILAQVLPSNLKPVNVRFGRGSKSRPFSPGFFCPRPVRGGCLGVTQDWLFGNGSIFARLQKPASSDELLTRRFQVSIAAQTVSHENEIDALTTMTTTTCAGYFEKLSVDLVSDVELRRTIFGDQQHYA